MSRPWGWKSPVHDVVSVPDVGLGAIPDRPLGILDDDEAVQQIPFDRAGDFRDVAPMIAVEIVEQGLGKGHLRTEGAAELRPRHVDASAGRRSDGVLGETNPAKRIAEVVTRERRSLLPELRDFDVRRVGRWHTVSHPLRHAVVDGIRHEAQGNSTPVSPTQPEWTETAY